MSTFSAGSDPTFVQVRPSGPTSARIMIVGEAPGDQEVQTGEPFVGQSGQELNRMLHEAGIMRSDCFVTNVVRQQPPGNDMTKFMPEKRKEIDTKVHVLCRDRMVMPCVREGLNLLRKEIELVKPTVIIALGNVSLWALTGNWGIGKWRSSQLVCDLIPGNPITVLPTYHPAGVLRQWSWRATGVHDLRKAARWAITGGDSVPPYEFITRPSFEQVLTTLDQLAIRAHHKDRLKLAVDLETRAGHIACIGLAWSKLQAICIPLMCVERKEGYWTEEQEAVIIARLYRLLAHPNVLCIGQNFLYDCQYIYRHWHFIPRAVRDTMISQHSCFSNLPKGLDYLSSMYCAHHVYWKDEGKEWNAKTTGEEQLWTYNCKDAVKTFEVDEVLQSIADKMGLRKVHDFQQSLFFPVLRAMLRGVAIGLKSRAEFASILQEEMAKRMTWLTDVLGHSLNPRSAPQMQRLFYDDLRQPKHWKKPKGRATKATLTLDDEALWKIATREPLMRPLVQKISEYRTLGVFFGTFVSAPLDKDQRMRCSFNIAGTETFRFSSSENAFGSGTNLQNIPSGKEDEDRPELELPNVRKLFIPDPGQFMWDIDLEQADLRIVVWESRCAEMKQMLREGRDPYLEVAKEFYRDPSLTKKSPKRQLFKSFCHGTHYLGTAKGLAARLGLLVHEAERTQNWYFQKFPAIKHWQDDFKAQVTSRRYVQNVFGHRIYVFDRLEGNVFNELAAWLPQSTVGILINHAWLQIEAAVREVEILLQVHDSLLGQGPIDLRETLVPRIAKAALVELPYEGDPLIIPVGVKTSTVSWGDCE